MLGEEVAHVRVAATDPLADELVEVADHLAVRGEVLGGHGPDGVAHAADELVEDLLAEPLHELVETGARVGLQEVVLAQVADPRADVARQRIQLIEPFRRDIAKQLLEVGVCRVRGAVGGLVAGGAGRWRGRVGRSPARAFQPPFDARPLLRDDLVQLSADVPEHIADLEPLAQLLAATAESIHEVLESGQVGTGRVAAAPATLHQPAQRLGEIAVGHDVVRELVEDLVRAEVGHLLAPVPARVAGAPGERGQRVVVSAPRCRAGGTRPSRSRGSGVYEVTGGRPSRLARAPC